MASPSGRVDPDAGLVKLGRRTCGGCAACRSDLQVSAEHVHKTFFVYACYVLQVMKERASHLVVE